VPTRSFHVGLFFDRLEGRALSKPEQEDNFLGDFKQTNFGFAMKAGGGAGRAFISFALDVGLATSADRYEGAARRVDASAPSAGRDGRARYAFKAAVNLAFGPAVMVVAGHTDTEDNVESLFWASHLSCT
jgi:hypothetical protein